MMDFNRTKRMDSTHDDDRDDPSHSLALGTTMGTVMGMGMGMQGMGMQGLMEVGDRGQYLESLVAKRGANFRYTRDIIQGDHFWFQCAHISSSLIDAYQEQITSHRLQQYYCLGMSMAKLLVIDHYSSIAHSLNQMFEEFEYHFASTAIQSMKYMMARTIEKPFPDMMHLDYEIGDNGDIKMEPKINRFLHKVSYEHLSIMKVGHSFDFRSIILSLMETLELVYERLLIDKGITTDQHTFEALLKVDAKVKHFIINPIAREFTDLSIALVSAELQSFKVWTC